MKKLNKNLKTLDRIILLFCLMLVPLTSLAKADDQNLLISKKWTKKCNEENKNCLIGTIFEIDIPGNEGKQTLATAYIRLSSKTERKMALVDEEEKTYKLKESNKLVPLLFINLPLNVDLNKNPLLQIDKKQIANITYSHCNAQVGCSTQLEINDEIIELLKEGKEIVVTFAGYRAKENKSVKFPLKGFTKSYNRLTK